MAVTKIKPIKTTLKKALDYIENPDKTDGKLLVSSFGCAFETADIEFEFTLSMAAMKKGTNLAHHMIQSFEPGEVEIEKAHEIGRQLADEVLQGKYEYVLTTHIDKGHIHNHIIFCAASFADHRKYNSNKKSLYGIRNISDRLCRENGLSNVIPRRGKAAGLVEYTDAASGERRTRPAKGSGKEYKALDAEKTDGSYRGKLRAAIDTVIPTATDYEDFLRRLAAAGYEIKRGKYTSFRAPGQERFTRSKTLGEDYTEERIKERIAGKRTRRTQPGRSDPAVSLIIDIENSIKAQESKGYEHWAKLHNLKEAAKTLNFLTENNILQYAALTEKIGEVQAANDEARAALKAVDQKMTEIALLMKNAAIIGQTKAVYDGLAMAKDKGKYRQEHGKDIILYEAAARALKAARVRRLPDITELQKSYDALAKEKITLSADYGALKKKLKEIGVIKKNIDSIIKPAPDKARGKGQER